MFDMVIASFCIKSKEPLVCLVFYAIPGLPAILSHLLSWKHVRNGEAYWFKKLALFGGITCVIYGTCKGFLSSTPNDWRAMMLDG
jgi:hypothetical protein